MKEADAAFYRGYVKGEITEEQLELYERHKFQLDEISRTFQTCFAFPNIIAYGSTPWTTIQTGSVFVNPLAQTGVAYSSTPWTTLQAGSVFVTLKLLHFPIQNLSKILPKILSSVTSLRIDPRW